jgi:HEAT repeat protein
MERAQREKERQQRDRERVEQAEEAYERGTEALDESEWQDAVGAFNDVVRLGGRRADGALYWKAYSLAKLAKKGEALSALSELSKLSPQSRWISEAKALEQELRASGLAATDANADEEMKLLALNALMNSDEGRAIPLLEGFLQGNHSPRLKDRALFVLSQSESPRAREILIRTAKSSASPDLQMRAIKYLGMSGDRQSVQALGEAYAASNDVSVRRAILRAFMMAEDTAPVLAAAKTEKAPELRLEAIRQLGAMEAADELLQLYRVETSVELKEEILQSLGVAEAVQPLGEIAKTEADPRLRRAAIQGLGIIDAPESGALLRSLYAAQKDAESKKAVMEALFVQDNAKALIEIAKAEKEPALRREAVEKLSLMDSREAQEYMLEILQK